LVRSIARSAEDAIERHTETNCGDDDNAADDCKKAVVELVMHDIKRRKLDKTISLSEDLLFRQNRLDPLLLLLLLLLCLLEIDFFSAPPAIGDDDDDDDDDDEMHMLNAVFRCVYYNSDPRNLFLSKIMSYRSPR
jgi:hypothetical protein